MMANGWDCWRNLREDRGDRQDRAGRDILIERAGKGVTIIPLGRPEMDLANQATIARHWRRRGRMCVSAAAYTAVDRPKARPRPPLPSMPRARALWLRRPARWACR
jgi:hypothetical protein